MKSELARLHGIRARYQKNVQGLLTRLAGLSEADSSPSFEISIDDSDALHVTQLASTLVRAWSAKDEGSKANEAFEELKAVLADFFGIEIKGAVGSIEAFNSRVHEFPLGERSASRVKVIRPWVQISRPQTSRILIKGTSCRSELEREMVNVQFIGSEDTARDRLGNPLLEMGLLDRMNRSFLPKMPLYNSDLLCDGDSITFSPPDDAGDEQSITRGLKGLLITDPRGTPFWDVDREDTETSLGEAVAFSMCCLLNDAMSSIPASLSGPILILRSPSPFPIG